MNSGDRSPSLTYHFVAFVDILGFSQMVEKDCSGPPTGILYLPKLLDLYESISNSEGVRRGISITQFSDSIVLSKQFSQDGFRVFAENVISFQHSLLINGVLCRGGISYGKHYERSNFLFSEALIKAYRIESEQAGYPRIVIDSDLIDLLSPNGSFPSEIIIQEADGANFLDYLSAGDVEENLKAVQILTVDWGKKPVRVREKLRWLREYFSFYYPDKSGLIVSRFQRI